MASRLFASVLIVSSIAVGRPVTSCAQPAAHVQYARVHFAQPILVHGKILVGDFVIEHDEARMDRGEPCTRLYRAGSSDATVAAFYCVLKHRGPAAKLTLLTRPVTVGGLKAAELVEYRFAGDSDAHAVRR